MILKQKKSLDDLIKGIKHVLLKDRCSFSDEERVLLKHCIIALQEFKKVNQRDKIPRLDQLEKVITILSKIFAMSIKIKELF